MYDPFDEFFKEFDRMHRRMYRLFGGREGLIPYKGEVSQARIPVSHVQETESNIIVSIELPGVEKTDIDLLVDDDRIELKVDSHEEENEDGSYKRTQRSFYRVIPLPKPVDSDRSTAKYDNGLLRIEAPKREKTGTRIDVQ